MLRIKDAVKLLCIVPVVCVNINCTSSEREENKASTNSSCSRMSSEKLTSGTVTPVGLQKLDLAIKRRPQNGTYVVRKGADFFYGNKPIRFWGVNLQAGEFKTYEAIDNVVIRLRSMGCNAVRLWATGYPFYTPESTAQGRMTTAEKGDGSKLDLYDYMVYRLQEEGLFIHNTSLGVHGPDMRYWPGIDVKLERKNKTGYDYNFYNVFPVMRYLHKGYREAAEQHIRMYLNRVNLYTGQRYAEMPVFATWELINENHTTAYLLEGRFHKWPPAYKRILQQRWNDWLLDTYGDRKSLIAAWGRLGDNEFPEKGTVLPAPTYKEKSDFPEERGCDFVRFVEHLLISTCKQSVQVARSCAPTGIGINVAPITANTHADLNMHAQYTDSVLDFMSTGVYQTPFTTDKKKKYYPWRPICTERPYFYNLNFQTLYNKPFIVYEHSFFRPYPYRAEWNPALMLLGAGLGWDSIYLYAFGQPWAYTDDKVSDEGFLTKPLPIPRSTSHDGYCRGFHHAGDEVLMASFAVTGQAFINGITPNKGSTRVVFGRPAIEGMSYKNYGNTSKAGVAPVREMMGGESEWYEMPDIYRKFMHTSVRKLLTLDFDLSQEVPIRVIGSLADMTVLGDEDREILNSSPDIIWDPASERFMLDAPHSKLISGFIREGYEFEDGIKLGQLNRDFAVFGVVARDGKPIAESEDILIALTSKSANTGFEFDPEKIEGSVLGHIKGVTDIGRAPVIVERVAAKIELPGVKGRLVCYDFTRKAYRTEDIDGCVEFSADEPLFLARIRPRKSDIQ